MRAVPAGIELRRATSDDIETVIALVEAEIGRYREWAPDWTPVPPSPEMRERLGPLFEDEERAWILLAFAGDEAVGVASLSVITAADARVPPEGTAYVWQMFVRRDQQVPDSRAKILRSGAFVSTRQHKCKGSISGASQAGFHPQPL